MGSTSRTRMDRAARLNRRSQPSGEEGAEAVVTMPAWNPENEAKSGVRTCTVLITVSGPRDEDGTKLWWLIIYMYR